MYLTKIALDMHNHSARQALNDANDMHRNLMACFPMDTGPDSPRADMNVLYRVMERRDEVYLLVTSEVRPDVSRMAARGFYADDGMIRDISPLKDRLSCGMTLRFELLASPCKKVAGDGNNSRRVFITSEEERAAWLMRKAEAGGFRILSLSEISSRVDKTGRRGGMVIKNSGVLFSGVLQITDSDAFWHSYTHGIGPGKAYGLGMLNVAK